MDSYRLKRPVCALTNGVDTAFFAPDAGRRAAFRRAYGLADSDPVVICAGHYFVRKGVLDFIELARAMPEVKFFWFGYTDPGADPPPPSAAPLPRRRPTCASPAMSARPNCGTPTAGADVFAFCSHEETEGIVVLEALACGIPVVVRDIPVYQGWLTDGKQVLKRRDTAGFPGRRRRYSGRGLAEAGRRGPRRRRGAQHRRRGGGSCARCTANTPGGKPGNAGRVCSLAMRGICPQRPRHTPARRRIPLC